MSDCFELASERDDREIRRLLSETPMTGDISVAFEREPNYFYGAAVEGDYNQIILHKKQEEIAAMASRSVLPVYLNGEIRRIGYLSQLRVRDRHRDLKLLVSGHRFLKTLRAPEELDFDLATIIADNASALKVLTSNRFGLPQYRFYGRLFTLAVHLRGVKNRPSEQLDIVQGSRSDASTIVSCLQRAGKDKQFYPVYTEEILESGIRSRGLKWDNFYLAKKAGRVVGVIAAWDQSDYKQTVVKSYSRKMQRMKVLYNFGAKWFRYTPLPDVNRQFPYFYASHIAIDDNDPDVFAALLRRMYNDYCGRGYSYMMIGLFETDALLKEVMKYKHIPYVSHLYLVDWGQAENEIDSLDERIPYLEIARL